MKDDGGPVYPQAYRIANERLTAGEWREIAKGMSLRDWFAGQALAGIIAGHLDSEYDFSGMAPSWARHAYALADAMLAARNSRD